MPLQSDTQRLVLELPQPAYAEHRFWHATLNRVTHAYLKRSLHGVSFDDIAIAEQGSAFQYMRSSLTLPGKG